MRNRSKIEVMAKEKARSITILCVSVVTFLQIFHIHLNISFSSVLSCSVLATLLLSPYQSILHHLHVEL